MVHWKKYLLLVTLTLASLSSQAALDKNAIGNARQCLTQMENLFKDFAPRLEAASPLLGKNRTDYFQSQAQRIQNLGEQLRSDGISHEHCTILLTMGRQLAVDLQQVTAVLGPTAPVTDPARAKVADSKCGGWIRKWFPLYQKELQAELGHQRLSQAALLHFRSEPDRIAMRYDAYQVKGINFDQCNTLVDSAQLIHKQLRSAIAEAEAALRDPSPINRTQLCLSQKIREEEACNHLMERQLQARAQACGEEVERWSTAFSARVARAIKAGEFQNDRHRNRFEAAPARIKNDYQRYVAEGSAGQKCFLLMNAMGDWNAELRGL